jgi:uncharacterized protein YraI
MMTTTLSLKVSNIQMNANRGLKNESHDINSGAPMQHLLIFALFFFSLPQVLASEEEQVKLEVIDPYVEMHSGPGRGYPVFYVIEQGESVEVITRRPGWYEVRAQNGKVGWTTAAQISRTLQTTGEPADLPTVSYGNYLKNRWRVGFSTGQFSSGELQGSDTFSFTAGYRPLSWAGIELEGGQFFNSDVKGKFYGLNILIEPYSAWKLSPLLIIGRGTLNIDVQPKLTPLNIDASDFNHVGLGVNYYLGRNFVFTGQYRSYSVSTDKSNERLKAWTIGFNTFF